MLKGRGEELMGGVKGRSGGMKSRGKAVKTEGEG